MEPEKRGPSRLFIGLMENLVFVFYLVMVLIVFVNVIGRFFFQAGITESEELSKILFVWISFIGIILCFHEDKHICVDILLNVLPEAPKKIVNIVANLLEDAILGIIFYYSINFVLINRGVLSPLTKIPVTLIQAIVPASMLIMLFMNLGKLVKLVRS